MLNTDAPLTTVARLEATMAAKEVIHFPFWAQLSRAYRFRPYPHPSRLLNLLLAENF